MQYSEQQIKDAFWKTFHKSSENFFDYLSTEEDNTYSTNSYWDEFFENLKKEYLEDTLILMRSFGLVE